MNALKSSIGIKIFSISAFIVTLMVATSIANAWIAWKIGSDMEKVTGRYLQSYGSIARAHIRTLEQALNLRRAIIAGNLVKSGPMLEHAKTALNVAIKEFWEEHRRFHEIVNLEISGGASFVDVPSLTRLDEKIKNLEIEQKHFESQLASYFALVESQKIGELNRVITQLEERRSEYNERFEDARRFMMKVTTEASMEARALQARAVNISLVLVALASLLALALAAFVTKSLVRPVTSLLSGTQSVISGRLDVSLPVTTTDEIGQLTHTFNEMTDGLRKGNRAREMFGRYVDPRIVKDLIDKPLLLSAEGDRKEMTVMFCDLKGFTDMSEGMTPKGLVKVLNRHFTLISQAISENGGVIDKFIGDAVMAYWGAPFNGEREHGKLACQAALASLAGLEQLKLELPELLGIKRNLPSLDIRVGIATGEVLVGNIGSDLTKNFTVIGDNVNLASRIEGVNKEYGTRNLISEATAQMAGSSIEFREIDLVLVPGKSEAKRVFEILGPKGGLSPERAQLSEHYGKGLASYRARSWAVARESFQACLSVCPGDGPSTVMLKRLEQFEREPPGESWNGAWLIAHK